MKERPTWPSAAAKPVAAVLFFSLLSATSAYAAGPVARDVMVKNEEARRIREITSEASITTGLGSDTKVKTFTWWRKLGDDAVHFRTLTRFHTPATIRGEGILIEERQGNANEVALYLPTFKKIRRVEGQSQSSSFMGSVFSYSDIAQPHVDDYAHTFVRTEACPAEPRIQCHVIASTPANDTVRERTGYSKTVAWIRTDNYLAAQVEFFDTKGQLRKRLVASQIVEVDKKTHRFFAHQVRIEDLKTHRFSVLQFARVHVNSNIPDSTFTAQNLARE